MTATLFGCNTEYSWGDSFLPANPIQFHKVNIIIVCWAFQLFLPTGHILLGPIDDECFWLIYSRCCLPVRWAFPAIFGGMLPSTVLSVSGSFIATASNQCTGRYWPFCSECCQQGHWPFFSWCCQPVWSALLAIFMWITPWTVGVSGHFNTDAASSIG